MCKHYDRTSVSSITTYRCCDTGTIDITNACYKVDTNTMVKSNVVHEIVPSTLGYTFDIWSNTVSVSRPEQCMITTTPAVWQHQVRLMVAPTYPVTTKQYIYMHAVKAMANTVQRKLSITC